MAEENGNKWFQLTKNRQLVAAALVFIVTLVLAYAKKWPFYQPPVDLGPNPSAFEILINERVTLGLLRAGIAAVVTYAIVSVPALIVGGRWMKGLTTSGLTADDAHTADQVIEDLEDELRATHDALQDQVTRNDLLSQFVLEVGAESEDNGPEGGAS